MANKYFTPEEIKMKRKCKATIVAMYATVIVWLLAACIGFGFFGSWLDKLGGSTPLMTAIDIILAFVYAAIILVIALLISYPFHTRIERYRGELMTMMHVVTPIPLGR